MANPSDPPDDAKESDARRGVLLAAFLRKHKKWIAIALLALPFLAFAIDRATHTGRVLRGVDLSGTSFSGLKRADAERESRAVGDRLRGLPLIVLIRDKRFELSPDDLGFELDVPATVELAMAAGRSRGIAVGFGFWLARMASAARLEAVVNVDPARVNSYFDSWQALAIPDRPFSGGIAIEGDHARADPARSGYLIDRPRALELIRSKLASPDRSPLELPLVKTEPFSVPGAVEAAVTRANRMLSGEVTLVAEGMPSARVTFTQRDLAEALRSREPTPSSPDVGLSFDPERIDQRLAALRAEIERPPQNASIAVDPGDKLRIVPSRSGTLLKAESVAEALLGSAASADRTGPLPIVVGAEPELTTSALEGLKITGLVSQFTTHHVCCQPRVDNIHRAADLLDGKIVKPGEIISLNVEIGLRTPKNGFKPAPTIEEGEMVDALGGGTSQFATTFFNAVFLGGYDIIERVPHTYYFSRYPMGRDATLSWPKPDIIFKNDTEAGMLIKASYTDTSITVKIYGDNGGRKVSFKVSPQTDAQKPGIEYIPDNTQSPDKEKVKEGGQIGWTVYVTREIRFPDGTKKEEKRKVVYKPRIRRVIVHPCRVPSGEPGYTGERCPEREGGVEGGTE